MPALSNAEAYVGLAPVLKESRFWGFTAALVTSSVAVVAVTVHVIPCLIERRHSPMMAGNVLGLIGLMQLAGRLAFGRVRSLLSWRGTTAAILMLQAGATAALATASTPIPASAD